VLASWRRVTGRSVLSVFGIRLLWVILPACVLGSQRSGRKWLLLPGGGIMVPRTTSWSRPFVRAGWNRGVSVREACNKLIPVLFVGCFLNPTFERAKRVNCDLWDIHKQKLEVLHNKIFVVEERSSSPSNLVATRCQHLLGWAVMRSLHYLSNEVELLGGNHITYSRYVIEHLSDVFISDLLFFSFLSLILAEFVVCCNGERL
jgi:hypothetical protein